MLLVSYVWSLNDAARADEVDQQQVEKSAAWHISSDGKYSYKYWLSGDELKLKFQNRAKSAVKIVSIFTFLRKNEDSFSRSVLLKPGQSGSAEFSLHCTEIRADNYKLEFFSSSPGEQFMQHERSILLNLPREIIPPPVPQVP